VEVLVVELRRIGKVLLAGDAGRLVRTGVSSLNGKTVLAKNKIIKKDAEIPKFIPFKKENQRPVL